MKTLFSILVLLTSLPFYAQVQLVKDGRPAAEIIVDPQAPRPAITAARELRHAVQLITGAELPVVNAPQDARKTQIHLICGDSPLLRNYAADLEKLKDNDGYAVRTDGRRMFIFAAEPRGLINGVNRLLHKNTDLVWARPHQETAVYSRTADLNFTQTDYLDIPAFVMRGWGVNRNRAINSAEYDIWNSRTNVNYTGGLNDKVLDRRLDLGFIIEFGGGHNMVNRWLPVKKFGEQHPEYYMLLDGKRRVTRDAILCHTNQDLLRDFTAHALEILKDVPPHYPVINIMMEDTNASCECPECEKPIRLPDGTMLEKSDEAFRSTQFFMFLNQVAEAIYEKYPQLQIKTFAYYFTAIPPKVKLFKTINVSYCPYIRNDKEPLTGKSNLKWKERLEGWTAITPNTILREYYFSGAAFPRAIANTAAQDLRFANRLGVRKLYSESSFADDPSYQINGKFHESWFWDISAPEHWVLNELFWDPAQDPDKLRDEYLRRVYREAAPAVQKFYRLIRDAWLNDPTPSAFNDNYLRSTGYYIVNKNLLAPCRQALAEAAALVKDPRSKELLGKLNATFEDWVKQAPSKQSGELSIPKSEIREFPGFDFESGAWANAATLPPLQVMGNSVDAAQPPTTVKFLQDGRNLYVGFYCHDPKPENLTALPAGRPHDTWPKGDHLELFFGNTADGYYHLAFDLNANRYDAILTNKDWNSEWTVRTQTVKDGWLAVVKIPFDSINFRIIQDNRLRTLIYRCQAGGGKRPVHSTWNGGVVHSPDSFGELVFDLE
jgi:hypothetical protein